MQIARSNDGERLEFRSNAEIVFTGKSKIDNGSARQVRTYGSPKGAQHVFERGWVLA